jgi:hypothetical protein
MVMSSPMTGYHSNALEVSYARVEQLFVPWYNITVTKHSLDLFLAEFKLPTEEDHALCKGSIDIGAPSS